MALEQEMIENEQNTLSDEEEDELKIMVNLAEDMIDDGGYQVIEQAMNSKDPAQVIGQFILQLGSQLGEQLPFEISPRIMLAEGGWVEQISDYLQEEYDVPKKIMDRAEIFIGSTAQGMAQQQQPAPAQPAMPQGGVE